jgi:hypothetical protein
VTFINRDDQPSAISYISHFLRLRYFQAFCGAPCFQTHLIREEFVLCDVTPRTLVKLNSHWQEHIASIFNHREAGSKQSRPRAEKTGACSLGRNLEASQFTLKK